MRISQVREIPYPRYHSISIYPLCFLDQLPDNIRPSPVPIPTGFVGVDQPDPDFLWYTQTVIDNSNHIDCVRGGHRYRPPPGATASKHCRLNWTRLVEFARIHGLAACFRCLKPLLDRLSLNSAPNRVQSPFDRLQAPHAPIHGDPEPHGLTRKSE